MRKLLFVLLLVGWTGWAWGACSPVVYYIKYAADVDGVAGDDANTGLAKEYTSGTTGPWKRAPGMVGFAGSYSHCAGDTFVFKGGVTWEAAVFPLTIGYSGTNTSCDLGANVLSCDTYIGGQNYGTPYGTGYPVFDGGDVAIPTGLIQSSQKSYIILDGIKIIKAGGATDGSGAGVWPDGGSFKEIRNMWLETNSVNAYADACTGGGATTLFHHNIVLNSGRIHVTCGTNTYDDYQFYNNEFRSPAGYYNGGSQVLGTDGETVYRHYPSGNHVATADDRPTTGANWATYWQVFDADYYTARPGGPSTWTLGATYTQGYHADGLMIQSDGAGAYKFTNIKIYNNKWTGDWALGGTGFFYTSTNSGAYGLQHVSIYNNLVAPNNTKGGMAAVFRFGYATKLDDIKIYNNTVDMSSTETAYQPSSMVSFFEWGSGSSITGVDIQNNIFKSNGTNAILQGATVTPTIEHNLYNIPANSWLINGSGGYCKTIAGSYPCSAFGWEQVAPAGQTGNPLFTSTTDWSLQAGSPAINKGAVVTGPTTDILGVTRGATWDVGAYEYEGETPDTTPPTLTSSTIPSDGLTIRLLFDEVVTRNAETGWAITMSGGTTTMSYLSGAGTNTLIYTLSRTVWPGETGTVAWTAAANTIEDAAGNDLATIATADVTNNSTATGAAASGVGVGGIVKMGVGGKIGISQGSVVCTYPAKDSQTGVVNTSRYFGYNSYVSIADKFTASATYEPRRMVVSLKKVGTGGTCVITGKIFSDNAGTPNTTVATSSDTIYAEELTTSCADYTFNFPTGSTITDTSVYWAGVSTTFNCGDVSNRPEMCYLNTGTGAVWSAVSPATWYDIDTSSTGDFDVQSCN